MAQMKSREGREHPIDAAVTDCLSAQADYRERMLKIPGAGRQLIEGNPLTLEEVEMFEMFEREGWPHDKRMAYILELVAAR